MVAVGQILDPCDLSQVLEIVRITGEVIGQRDEEAHAFTKGPLFREEVDTLAGHVLCGSGFLEGRLARIGRSHPDGLPDADAAAAPAFLLPNFLHVNMGPRKRRWLSSNVP